MRHCKPARQSGGIVNIARFNRLEASHVKLMTDHEGFVKEHEAFVAEQEREWQNQQER
jgi:hypothetical protein